MDTHRKAKKSGAPKPTHPRPTKASSPTKLTRNKSISSAKRPDRKPSPKAKQAVGKPRAKPKTAAPRTESQYAARPEKFKDTWDRVIGVIAKMRNEKVSLTQASRDAGISPRTVARWGNPALRKGSNGKYAAKASDSLLRIVRIPTPEGQRDIGVRGSKQVSLLGEYWNALDRYLQTGDATRLKQFQGKHIKDANGVEIPLLVDQSALNRLGSAGVLSFESLYARSA